MSDSSTSKQLHQQQQQEQPEKPGTSSFGCTSTTDSSESTSGTTNVDKTRIDGLSRLLEKQFEEIDILSRKIDLFTQYKNEYKNLSKSIDKMSEKVKHPHRIPVAGTNLAFLDGQIIHTNEYHVLLGDNYFALRSAKQAGEIINRRLKDIDNKLNESQEAKRKAEKWLEVTEEHRRDKEEFVEIIETM